MERLNIANLNTIIDIGAGVGEFSNGMMSFNPNCKVYCFEPIPETYGKLKSWAKGKPNVRTFNIAIGNEEGIKEMDFCVTDPLSSSMLEPDNPEFGGEKKKLVVYQTKLDSVMADKVLQRELFVKIDVEGMEDKVIIGGKNTISEAKGCMIEVHLAPLRKKQPTFRDIFVLMDSLGFEYCGNASQSYIEHNAIGHIDALFRKKSQLYVYDKEDIKKNSVEDTGGNQGS